MSEFFPSTILFRCKWFVAPIINRKLRRNCYIVHVSSPIHLHDLPMLCAPLSHTALCWYTETSSLEHHFHEFPADEAENVQYTKELFRYHIWYKSAVDIDGQILTSSMKVVKAFSLSFPSSCWRQRRHHSSNKSLTTYQWTFNLNRTKFTMTSY